MKIQTIIKTWVEIDPTEIYQSSEVLQTLLGMGPYTEEEFLKAYSELANAVENRRQLAGLLAVNYVESVIVQNAEAQLTPTT